MGMDKRRFRHILSRLKYYDLTDRERFFVDAVRRYFEQKQQLSDQQESILEGIHKEKLRWAARGLIRRKRSIRSPNLKAK
jgi:hypothetical protein